jgi:hypothetical protein
MCISGKPLAQQQSRKLQQLTVQQREQDGHLKECEQKGLG